MASGAQRLCEAWRACGGRIVADLARPCTHFGPANFVGCVGARRKLRESGVPHSAPRGAAVPAAAGA